MFECPDKRESILYDVDLWKSDQGKVFIIFGALYGLKYSDFSCRNHIYEILGNHQRLQSSLADPRSWFKAATDNTRNEDYTYILVYVDYWLIFDKYPQKYMAMLERRYTVKP